MLEAKIKNYKEKYFELVNVVRDQEKKIDSIIKSINNVNLVNSEKRRQGRNY
jgi:hypothetical protein